MNMKLGVLAKCLHWLILALCIYAIGCCGFHWLPVWGLSENYESINATLLSIALSYVAGFIIYLFTSELPRKQRENEIFDLWSPHLSILYNDMSERIEELRVFLGIPQENMSCLSLDDCKVFETYTSMIPSIKIKKDIDRGKTEHLKVNDDFNIKKKLNQHHDAVVQCIEMMLDNPMAIYANNKLLDTLSQIKASRFLKECNSIIAGPIVHNGKPVIIRTPELPKAFWEYVGLRNQLATFSFKKHLFKMQRMSDEEIKASKRNVTEQLASMGMTEETAREIGDKIVKASIH